MVSVQVALAKVLHDVGDMGWDSCCWSANNLLSKRIYPKYQFPSKSKKWRPRIKTSENSMGLMAQRAQAPLVKLLTYMRKRAGINTVQVLAARAAVVWNLSAEVHLSLCRSLTS